MQKNGKIRIIKNEKGRKAVYSVGDTVLYSSLGICTVKEIISKTVGKVSAKYYVLSPVFNGNNTFFVPADNETLTAKMFTLLSESGAKELIRLADTLELYIIENDNLRRETYKLDLTKGDRTLTARIIKTLSYEQNRRKEIGKRLHIYDQNILNLASKLLFEEMGFALNTTPKEAEDEFMKAIKCFS